MLLRYESVATLPSGARAGLLHTRRGVVETPTFMPVATHANMTNLSVEEIQSTGAKILLSNTFHLWLTPGADVFEKFGGIHSYMKWPGLVLTDSGGYQIFSLADDRALDEEGAHFTSFIDQSKKILSPEVSIAMQQSIGSDIMMVLDVCIDSRSDEAATKDAMERTHRWAIRSLYARNAKDTGQALFAIVQGGVFKHLREQSAAFLTPQPFDGFAIGGLAVGEERSDLYEMCGFTAPLLPKDKPRYLMGVGTPIDLLECSARGVDMFDCIIPSMMAQQAWCYTFQGKYRVSKSMHRLSDAPLEPGCDCPTCKTHSRGYLQHLMLGKHTLGSRLLTLHNVWMFEKLMRRIRAAIIDGTFESLYAELKPVIGRTFNAPPF
jgi:queuine tRNA-ribosyltransferase